MKTMTNKKKKVLIWIVAVLLVIIIDIFTVIPFIVMHPLVDNHVYFNEIWEADEFGLEANHFFVQTEDGLTISAYEVAVDTPKAVIICLSGIQNPSVTVYFGHAKLFKENDFATILVDMRAHGESSGNEISLGYKEYIDVKAVVAYIKQHPVYDNVPVIVMGVSMGGATAINAIAEIDEIDGLISLSSYSSWEEVYYENMKQSVPAIVSNTEYPFIYLMSLLKYGSSSFIKPKTEIKKLKDRPALLMHSKQDSQVSFANFERLLKAAPAHVETFIREGDLHFMTEHFLEPEKDTLYAETLVDFINHNFIQND